ncbi:MAG: hypothetical protein HUJ86_06900, partial [Synergistes sp.]|nr:hypothetical protein [Synergistes sp.]
MTEINSDIQENSLISLDDELWRRNKSVFLASKGAVRTWVCRGIDSPLLVIVPDARQAR